MLDVVALKNGKMRGQAHVAFRDVQASTQAMRALQGFDFFGKEMVRTTIVRTRRFKSTDVEFQKIAYAKGKSDAVAKLDGTYKMPVTVNSEVTSTALQQSVFGAPPSSFSASLTAPPPGARVPDPVKDNEMAVDREDDEPKGVKRGRGEESDDEGAPMEEDSDAPMEASSDEEDD